MALVEVNELKAGASDYTQYLNELEAHTTRIFDLVANMLKHANYLKENETKGLLEKLENIDTILAEYQGRMKKSEAMHRLLRNKPLLRSMTAKFWLKNLKKPG